MAVTIMADTCFIADTIATGLFVMGPEEASKWLTVHSQYPAMLVVKEVYGHKSVIYFNGFKRLKKYLSWKNLVSYGYNKRLTHGG